MREVHHIFGLDLELARQQRYNRATMPPPSRWRVAAVVAAALAAPLWAQSLKTVTKDPRVDAIFKNWTSTTPGCTVGADVKGKPVVRAAYGLADLEHDVPIATDTILEAGSVSKQFTAIAVLLLARDGKLSLDDRIHKYFPELPDFGVPVTIRHMLQHTSGLRDWGSLANISGWPRTSRVHTHAHVLDILSRQRALDFPPGSRWSYSNSGYNLAAILVARVSGMPFADFTRERIFQPLGMTNTSWRDDYRRVVKRRAIAYGERQGAFITDMPFENVHGNGGLLTTVDDLLKWNANFSQPVVGDAAVLTALQTRSTLTNHRSHEYALGLYVDTYKGVTEIDHSGATAGYRAHLSRYPDQQVSVAVLCNVASANATAYAKAVAELHLTGLQAATSPSPSRTLTTTDADRLIGLYRSIHPRRIAVVLRDKEGHLIIENFARLIPATTTRFSTSEGHTMEFDGGGELRATDEFGVTTVFNRVERVTPALGELTTLAGRYVSDEIETTFDLVVDDGRLVLRRRPDTSMALTPVYADAFTSPLGWIVFHRDASRRVTGLSVSQDRVWDLRFVRQPDAVPTSAPR